MPGRLVYAVRTAEHSVAGLAVRPISGFPRMLPAPTECRYISCEQESCGF